MSTMYFTKDEQLEHLERRVSELLTEMTTLKTKHSEELRGARRRATAPFKRSDLEGMTREQLLSLVEEGINEGRRKGLLEVEGLLSKQTSLSEETDLELMRGVVSAYSRRIQDVLDARKNRQQSEVSLDMRPLVDKLDAATKSALARPTGTSKRSFLSFDKRAKALAELARPRNLVEGVAVSVLGDHGTHYELMKKGEVTACSCPSWIHGKVDNTRRTCKHLRAYLGDAAEDERTKRPAATCWCGFSLIRGQCQFHTAKWLGDERCTCGRRFDFCAEEYHSGRGAARDYHKPTIHRQTVTALEAAQVGLVGLSMS